jgi:hypothetical protein
LRDTPLFYENFVHRLDFAAQEVKSYLKGRSRIIQFTDCKDGVLKIAKSRVLYESPEKNPVVSVNPAPMNEFAGREDLKVALFSRSGHASSNGNSGESEKTSIL